MKQGKKPEPSRGGATCVVGWPAAHSRSPLIHKHWIEKYGVDGEYRSEAVPPERLAEFFGDFAKRGYIGANVTLPHK
ncbi:MAG: hypothetical protein HY056_16480, partial [Proteobacteria bacterium]|nr:hypothetical protein [Pseudomonadota bacterium]